MGSRNRLTPDEELEAEQELERDIFRGDLFTLCRDLLGYRQMTWFTHGDICTSLEDEKKRKLIVYPRGTFKSSICSVGFPIQRLMQDPNLRVLLDGELYTNSKNFLREISTHLQSQEFTNVFGDCRGTDVWNEGEIIIRQRTKTLKEASITASGIGAEKTGQHYDLIICDDLNSPSNSGTKEGRAKVISHYRYLTSILEPEGTLAIVATRYNAEDIPGFVIRNEIEIEGKGLLEKR